MQVVEIYDKDIKRSRKAISRNQKLTKKVADEIKQVFANATAEI